MLVLAIQVINVIVARVADVQLVMNGQQSLHLTLAGRSFYGALSLPKDQRARYAESLSRPAIHVEWDSKKLP